MRCKAHGGRKWVPLRCRECPGCLRYRLLSAQRRIAAGLLEVEGTRAYAVLTSPLDAEWAEVMRWFHSWIKAVRKYAKEHDWPEPVEYAWTKEEGSRNGMKHLNILFVGWRGIDQVLLSRWWERASKGRAFRVHIGERIQKGRYNLNSEDGARAAAFYVSKYATKEGVAGFQRLVGFSRGWAKDSPSMSECRWELDGEDMGTGRVPSEHVEGVTLAGALVLSSPSPLAAACTEYGTGSEDGLHLWLYGLSRAPDAGPYPRPRGVRS